MTPDEELDQLEHEERTMMENNQGRFDPAPFDPATVSIEVVWNWLCQRVPGLRESPGLGIPPNDKAGPLTYCEASLYYLIGEALAIRPVWSIAGLSEGPKVGICQVVVDFYAGYTALEGRTLTGCATTRCVWGEPGRQPAKEARLRAAADMLFKQQEREKP